MRARDGFAFLARRAASSRSRSAARSPRSRSSRCPHRRAVLRHRRARGREPRLRRCCITAWTLGMAAGAAGLAHRVPRARRRRRRARRRRARRASGSPAPAPRRRCGLALIGFAFGGVAHGVKNVAAAHADPRARARGAARPRFAAYNGARNGAELGALAARRPRRRRARRPHALLAAGLGPALIGALASCCCSHDPSKGVAHMHASRADLPAQVLGEYEGRFVDWGETRVAFETMPASFPPDESPFTGPARRPLPVPALGLRVQRARSASPTSTAPRSASTRARPTTCARATSSRRSSRSS